MRREYSTEENASSGLPPMMNNSAMIQSISAIGEKLHVAMDITDKWDDETSERFLSEVKKPVEETINDFVKDATDAYQVFAAAVQAAKDIAAADDCVVGSFASAPSTIHWYQRRMFPDLLDEILLR